MRPDFVCKFYKNSTQKLQKRKPKCINILSFCLQKKKPSPPAHAVGGGKVFFNINSPLPNEQHTDPNKNHTIVSMVWFLCLCVVLVI